MAARRHAGTKRKLGPNQNGVNSHSFRGRRKSADNDLQNLKRSDPFNTDTFMGDSLLPPMAKYRSKSQRKSGKQSKSKTPKKNNKFHVNNSNGRDAGFPFTSNHNMCNTPAPSTQSSRTRTSYTSVSRRHRHPPPSQLHPHKKAKLMQAASSASSSSSSSSDIEILDSKNRHMPATHPAPHRRAPKSFNIYDPDGNTHRHRRKSRNHYDLELEAVDQAISGLVDDVIPFSAEKDRRKVHSENLENIENDGRNAMDCDSLSSRLSRRSKSRSPQPAQCKSPASEVKEKMTEDADRLVLNALRSPTPNKTSKTSKSMMTIDSASDKDKIRTRHAMQLLGKTRAGQLHQQKKKNKKTTAAGKHGRQYSALTTLPASQPHHHQQLDDDAMDAFTPQRHCNPGGRHRPRSRRKGQFLRLNRPCKSSLQCLPVSSDNGRTLNVEAMDQNTYAHLLQQEAEQTFVSDESELSDTHHHHHVNYVKASLLAFVEETDAKMLIDLTNSNEGTPKTLARTPMSNDEEEDEEDDDDDDEIEILNDISVPQKKRLQKQKLRNKQKRKQKQKQKQKQKSTRSNNDRDELLQLKKQSEARFDNFMESEMLDIETFNIAFNAQAAPTERICAAIVRYQEEKRRQMEEEERVRKEQAFLEEQNEAEETTQLRHVKFTPLEDDDLAVIEQVQQLPAQKMIQRHVGSNIDVCVKDLRTLGPGKWLNDEVMNFYMALLQDRNNHRCQQQQDTGSRRCRVLLMNTFFYTKLSSNGGYNYKAVKRWTKKNKLAKRGLNDIETIFEFDKFIFPVHVNGIHWCCGCVNFKRKRIEYFDSMNGSANMFFKTMRKFVTDEFKDKLNNDTARYKLEWSEWSTEDNKSKYPQQQNGYDCGVFTSKCADWISDDLYPDYTQQDMTMFRKRMVVEIVRGKTLDF